MMSGPFLGMMVHLCSQGVYFKWHLLNLLFLPLPLSLVKMGDGVWNLLTLPVFRDHIHKEATTLSILRGLTELELVWVSEIGFRVNQRLNSLLELLMVFEGLSPQDVDEMLIILVLVLVLPLLPEKLLVMFFLFNMAILLWIKTMLMLMRRWVFLCFLPDEVNFNKEAWRQVWLLNVWVDCALIGSQDVLETFGDIVSFMGRSCLSRCWFYNHLD